MSIHARTPTQRVPAYKVLADSLRAQITSGRLRPGDRLPTEPQLCQSSGVSRSTVREALRLLASQNLIVTTRGVAGGSFVVHPSPSQLCDTLTIGMRLLHANHAMTLDHLLEVHEMIEVPVAGLAAARRRDGDLQALRAALFDPYVVNPSELLDRRPEFHVALARASGNPLMELIVPPLGSILQERELRARMCDRDFLVRLDADHREILDAVERSDAKAAEDAARRHLAYVRRELTRTGSADDA